jgi:hypothetical protein
MSSNLLTPVRGGSRIATILGLVARAITESSTDSAAPAKKSQWLRPFADALALASSTAAFTTSMPSTWPQSCKTQYLYYQYQATIEILYYLGQTESNGPGATANV